MTKGIIFANITITGDFETPVVSVVLDYEELDSFGDIITDTTVDAFYNMWFWYVTTKYGEKCNIIVKLRERKREGVAYGKSLKGHLLIIFYQLYR